MSFTFVVVFFRVWAHSHVRCNSIETLFLDDGMCCAHMSEDYTRIPRFVSSKVIKNANFLFCFFFTLLWCIYGRPTRRMRISRIFSFVSLDIVSGVPKN